MDFQLYIKNLENTVNKLNEHITIITEEETDAESTSGNLATESWDGKAKEEFQLKFAEWKSNMDAYIKSVTFMRDTLNNEILPKAKELNNRCLGFAGLLGSGAGGSQGDDILTLDKTSSNQVLSLLNLCAKDVYVSEVSELSGIESELSGLSFTSFLSGGEISSCKEQIKNIQNKMTDFYDSLTAYNKGIDELQELMISRMSEIKAPDRFQKVINSGFINENIADLIKSIEEKALASKLSIVNANGSLDDLIATLKGLSTRCSLFSKDPVNLTTGNFVFEKEDLEIVGAFPIAFKRTYNSIDDRKGVLGENWTHNFEVRLLEVDNVARILFEDGHVQVFKKNSNGTFLPNKQSFQTLEYSENNYILKSVDKLSYVFSKDGRCIKKVDCNGNELIFNYNDYSLISVENNSGKLYFYYDSEGYLISVKDHGNRKVMYEYTDEKLTSVIDEEGNSYDYKYGHDGIISDTTNPRKVNLVHNEFDDYNRTIKQTFPDGGVMSYDYLDHKNQVILTEQNGNKITYVKDEKFRNTKIIYSDGSEDIEYNEQNLKSIYKDKNGNKSYYEYDQLGNLTQFIDASGNVTKVKYDKNSKPIYIRYSDNSEIKNIYDSKGNLVKYIDQLGRTLDFEHYSNGKTSKVIKPDGSELDFKYDDKGNIIEFIDVFGAKTTYEYDDLNRVIKTVDGNNNTTKFIYNNRNRLIQVINTEGNSRHYEYDPSENITRIIDFDGSVTKAEYTELNNVKEIIDSCGNSTELEYDLMWNISKIKGANGLEIAYSYNALNRLASIKRNNSDEIKYEYDPNGNNTKIISSNNYVKQFIYDELNRKKEVIDENGSKTTFIYDSLSRVSEIVDNVGNITAFEYDAAGQLIKRIDSLENETLFTYNKLGLVESIINPSGGMTKYSYYLGGRLKKVCYPGNETEEYEYDANGNLTKRTDKLGNSTQFIYDCLDRMVEYINPAKMSRKFTYDPVGNVTSLEDEAGNITKYKYSPKGELIEVIDPMGNKATYDYDSAGHMTRVNKYELIDDELANTERLNSEYKLSQVTSYNYDEAGRLIQLTDPLGNSESFAYDTSRNTIDRIDKDGYSTKYKFNSVNNLEEILYSDGKRVELTYNSINQLVAIKDWLGTTTIDVDPLGRTLAVTDYNDDKVSYSWGKMGEKKSMTYPDGHKVNYNYDMSLNLISVEENNNTINYAYDEIGRLKERVLPNNSRMQYAYNELNRIISLKNITNNEILDSYKFEYDSMGNKITTEKNRNGIIEDNGIFNYEYDKLQRLVTVKKDNRILREYEYDNFGNRTTMKDSLKTVKYRYNELNQLINMNDGIETTDYNYDKRGNMIEVFKQGKLNANYKFGLDNKMKISKQISGLQKEYTHNGLGWRVGESVQSGQDPIKKIQYILDFTRTSGNIIEKREDKNVEQYIWDRCLIKSQSDLKNNYYLQDEMGSNIRLLEENGSLLDSYGFDEFGTQIAGGEKYKQTFGFTGFMNEEGSDLYFANARYYNPSHGRFISEDKVKGFGISPKTLNVYTYAFNNPMNYVDLDGAWPSLSDIGNGVQKAWDGTCNVAEKAWDGTCNGVKKAGEGASYVWNNYVYGTDVTTTTTVASSKNGMMGVFGSETRSQTKHTGGSILVHKVNINTTYSDENPLGTTKTSNDISLKADLKVISFEAGIGDGGLQTSLGANIFGIKPQVSNTINVDAENWISEDVNATLGYGDNKSVGIGASLGLSPYSTLDLYGFNGYKTKDGVSVKDKGGLYVRTAPVYVTVLAAAAIFLLADDTTGVGVADDPLLAPITGMIGELLTVMGAEGPSLQSLWTKFSSFATNFQGLTSCKGN